jgi:hypothetical protein
MVERAVLPGTHRALRPRQSAAEDQRVYAEVTARDVTCRAPIIQGRADNNNGALAFRMALDCSGKLERHHAFTGVGSRRITDARHVVLLCEWHHRNWAPSHARLILEWLAAL